MTKMYSKGGIMKVRHVMELPPTRFRILPKLGTVSVMQVCVVFVILKRVSSFFETITKLFKCIKILKENLKNILKFSFDFVSFFF